MLYHYNTNTNTNTNKLRVPLTITTKIISTCITTLLVAIFISPTGTSTLTLALSSSSSSSEFPKIKVTPCTRICRYNSNFFDGQVCIGCFRDTTEISAWSQMSNVEKGYALEDAAERCESQSQGQGQGQNQSNQGNNPFEAAIDKDELRKQALSWFALSKNEKMGKNGEKDSDSHSDNHSSSMAGEDYSYNDSASEVFDNINIPSPVSDTIGSSIGIDIDIGMNNVANTDLDTPTSASHDEKYKNNNNKQKQLESQENINSNEVKENKKDFNIDLLSPCKGLICNFDPNIFDGQVCTNCFRDTFEINNWNQFNEEQKMMALMDMEDRARQMSSSNINESSGSSGYENKNDSIVKNNDFDAETNHYQWEEIDIETQQKIKTFDVDVGNDIDSSSTTTKTTFDNFLECGSVILVPSIINESDCKDIISRVSQIADDHRIERLAKGLADEGIVRLPTIDAANRAKKHNTPFAKHVDDETDMNLKCILMKVFNILDVQLSPLISSLFGKESSISSLYELDHLMYSSREPAINVYTEGGKFLAHKDGQQLTVLIPLSSPDDDFGGGGTSFWSQESRGHRVDPPSLILKPTRGTVMLFGGHVTHAGQPVEWGKRVVFVASFSKINDK